MRLLTIILVTLGVWSSCFAQPVPPPSPARMGVTPTATPEGLYVLNAVGAWVQIGTIENSFNNTTIAYITTTGTIPCVTTTTIFDPVTPAVTTCQLPTLPVDREVHTLVCDDVTSAFNPLLDGNGHNVGSGGDTGVLVLCPGSVNVIYSSASNRWEIGG